MPQKYSREAGSLFPETCITPTCYKDIDDTVVSLIKQYYQLLNNENVKEANTLLERNYLILEPYAIDSAKLNLLTEEIYNIGLYARSPQKNVISSEEPAGYSTGSYWLLEYQ